jgi:hypothetical protein
VSATADAGFDAREWMPTWRRAGAAMRDTVMTVDRDGDPLHKDDEGQTVKRAPESATLPLLAEELSVSKETVETGRVRDANARARGAANIFHQPRASPDSTSLASRIEFPTMTPTLKPKSTAESDHRRGATSRGASRSCAAHQLLEGQPR